MKKGSPHPTKARLGPPRVLFDSQTLCGTKCNTTLPPSERATQELVGGCEPVTAIASLRSVSYLVEETEPGEGLGEPIREAQGQPGNGLRRPSLRTHHIAFAERNPRRYTLQGLER